jgi:hypothetical protein
MEFLTSSENIIADLLPPDLRPAGPLGPAVKVIDLGASGSGQLSVYLDARESRGVGLLG